MNRDFCIFNENKPCDNCGQCERCDLIPDKKCNNCGKCLEAEGYDMKAIKIDQIIEDEVDADEYEGDLDAESENHSHFIEGSCETLESNDDYLDYKEEDIDTLKKFSSWDEVEEVDDFDENIEFIDDIDGLNELLQDEDRLKRIASEDFPGFIRIKNTDE